MISVAVAIHSELCRLGLATLVGQLEDMRVAGTAGTLADTEQLVASAPADVLILDAGFHAAEPSLVARLRTQHPGTRILVFSEHAGLEADPRCASALRAGASGCLVRTLDHAQFLDAVRRAASGAMVLPPERPPLPLTGRELEIVAAVADGLDNRSIAQRLGLREQTVKNRLTRIMAKTGVRGRVQLVRWALEHGAAGALN